MSKFGDLAFGTGNDRRRMRVSNEHENTTHEVVELGKTAIAGIVVAGTVGVIGGMLK